MKSEPHPERVGLLERDDTRLVKRDRPGRLDVTTDSCTNGLARGAPRPVRGRKLVPGRTDLCGCLDLVGDLGIALAGVVHEAGLGLLEPQLDLAGWPVAMLGQLQVDDLAIRVLVLAGAFLLAPQEHDQVGVLLDRPGLAQVRQAWLA